MPKRLLPLLLLMLVPLARGQSQPAIPEPPELEPDVRFWVRVYSEVSTSEGFIHDQWNLAAVYETVHLPPDAPAGGDHCGVGTVVRGRLERVWHRRGIPAQGALD